MRRPYRPTLILVTTALIDCLYEVGGMYDGATIEEMEAYERDLIVTARAVTSCYRV